MKQTLGCFLFISLLLLLAGCNGEELSSSYNHPLSDHTIDPDQNNEYGIMEDDYHSTWDDDSSENLVSNNIQCPPLLEPLFQALPSANELEGLPLIHQSCGYNLAVKQYGSLDQNSNEVRIVYNIISYTREYADLPGMSATIAEQFLAEQRQGWDGLIENLREQIRWAEDPDFYTDYQLARLPKEFIWQDSMPAILDNGSGFWGLYIWLTPDVMAQLAVLDVSNPDPTAQEALDRLIPLANKLNPQQLASR